VNNMGAGLKITGLKELNANLKNAGSKGISDSLIELLDRVAKDTKDRMSIEAPKGRSLRLSKEITIMSPDKMTRVITPEARNSSNRMYASAVETGTSNYSTLPNLTSLSEYYGIPLFVANERRGGRGEMMNPQLIGMAKAIMENGTPANPFVTRTFNFMIGKMDQYSKDFADKLVFKIVKY